MGVDLSSAKLYLIDPSALLSGVSERIEEGSLNGRIAIHEAHLVDIEERRNAGKISGIVEAEELEKLKEVTERMLIPLEVVSGERGKTVNESVRKYCASTGAILVTADEIQRSIAEISGINYFYIENRSKSISLESMFDENTMSVHLKEGTTPKAKKGKPGSWEFKELSNKVLSSTDIRRVVSEILREVRLRSDSFIESERKGSMIIQLQNYRIVITRAPLSDGWEVTVTRPVARKKLEDYNLPEEVKERLALRAEGIIVAGSPGMGKTTFAQALSEFYSLRGKIVKTIESPRDMHLPPEITQYSKSYAELGELHDILLLSRPDYTVFDEMRNDEDFRLYVDLRLAGIGMVGVVHATTPIDAIHRFLNRADLGTIPNIVDTVIFIKNGNVDRIYTLEMKVKMPTGLKESDLTRPVVEVKDFMTNKVEYEIYVFGEQIMIIPVKGVKASNALEDKVMKVVSKYMPEAQVRSENGELIVEIPRKEVSRYNKRIASQLHKIERRNGVKIRVRMSEESEE